LFSIGLRGAFNDGPAGDGGNGQRGDEVILSMNDHSQD